MICRIIENAGYNAVMSESVYTADLVCPGCGSSVPAEAERCVKCGKMLGLAQAPAPRRAAASPVNPIPLDERRWMVISLMVFAALFLGFPFLWKSRAFTRGEKIFWTIAVLIETVVIFWLFYIGMAWAIGRIRDALP